MLLELWNDVCAKLEKDYCMLRPDQRAMAPFAAEIAAAKFMRLVGIGTAPQVAVMSASEALALDRRSWVIKGESGRSSLTAALPPGLTLLCVAKIPRAVPLSWLRKRYGIAAEIPVVEFGEQRYPLDGVLWRGKEELQNAAEFYSDFTPPPNGDWSAVLAAIQWDSVDMLRIYAARLFLGATTAHASNVLVDRDAKLYSIDHADIAKTDGSEIDELFASVERSTRAGQVLRPFCALTPSLVSEIFASAAGYFVERLRRWQAAEKRWG